MGTNQPTTQDLLSQAARLHEIARRLVGDSHLADDLVQDAWVVALEADVSRASSWRDVEGWRAWIGGVARNLSARRAQRDARRREIEAVVAKSEATIEENHLSDRMHVQRQLAGAVLELDEPFRSALVMRYLDDLDYEQLAERQGISIANARQRVRRALAILRTRMGADDKGRFGVLGLLGLGDSFDKGARALASLTAGQLAIGGVVMGVKSIVGLVALVAGATYLALYQPSENLPFEEESALANSAAREPVALMPRLDHDLQPLKADTERVEEPSNAVSAVASVATDTAVFGRLRGSRGNLLAGVRVRVCDGEGNSVQGTGSFTTDGDGRYRMPGTELPSSLRFKLKRFVPLIEAPPRQGEFDVVLLRAPQLSGQVRNEVGDVLSPPGKVRVDVLTNDSSKPEHLKTELSTDGCFLFDDLSVGRIVQLWARVQGYDERALELSVPAEAESRQTIDVELPLGMTITGVVLDEELRTPIPFAKVWTDNMKYEADSVEPATVADSEGRFRVEGVSVDIRSFNNHEYNVVRLMASSETHTASPLKAYLCRADENEERDFEVLLVRRSCSLTVVFHGLDGESPVSGLFVWSIDSERNSQFRTSNRDGEIEPPGLPAGKLGIVAYRTERNETGFYEMAAEEFDLQAGSHGRIELPLVGDQATSIMGRVLDLSGKPVAGLEVKASFDYQSSGMTFSIDSETRLTDEQGRYNFYGLRPGRNTITPTGCAMPRRSRFSLGFKERLREVDFVVDRCMVVMGWVVMGWVVTGDYKAEELKRQLFRIGFSDPVRSTRPEQDGSLVFDEVVEARYDLVPFKSKLELSRVQVNVETCKNVVLRAD